MREEEGEKEKERAKKGVGDVPNVWPSSVAGIETFRTRSTVALGRPAVAAQTEKGGLGHLNGCRGFFFPSAVGVKIRDRVNCTALLARYTTQPRNKPSVATHLRHWRKFTIGWWVSNRL